MQPSEREKIYLQREKNKKYWIKPLVKNKSTKSKEGIGMADSDEMEKKFFQDIQNTQKKIVDSLAETRVSLRILTEKLQGNVSTNEKGNTSEELRNLKATPTKLKYIYFPTCL